MTTLFKKIVITKLLVLLFIMPALGQEYIDYEIEISQLYAKVRADPGEESVEWEISYRMASSTPSGELDNVKSYGHLDNYSDGLNYDIPDATIWSGKCLDNADNLYIYVNGWRNYVLLKWDIEQNTNTDANISGNPRNTWPTYNSGYAYAGSVSSFGYYKAYLKTWWDWSLPVNPSFTIDDLTHTSFVINLGSTSNYRVGDWDYQVSTSSDFTTDLVSGNITEDIEITGLDPNTAYYVRIRGNNERGSGSYTSYQSVTTTKIIYVTYDPTSTSGGDGTSWGSAFLSFQDALADAASTNQIWVAAGTYIPSVKVVGTTDRDKAFQMINGVTIYGGFAGTETAISQRDISANETILSGDIGITDDDDDNCYHVIYNAEIPELNNTAILDGFSITKGNANYNSGTMASGGAIFNFTASATIRNCSFYDNYGLKGGAIINFGESAPEITNCVFYNNSASKGGAMYNQVANAIITNCTFTNNTATSGGAFYNISGVPSTTNCTFTNNSAYGTGGAFYNVGDNPSFTNCIFWSNSATTNNEIYSSLGVPTFNFCDIEGGYTGTGNINSNPQFVDVVSNDFRISENSPCTDEGLDVANNETYDIRGSDFGRKLLRTDYLTTGPIDMGAYEYNSNTDPLYPALYWTAGASTTDWNTTGNWDADVVPTSDYNVVIPNLATDPAIAYDGTADCNNLTVDDGATLTIQSTDAGTGSLIVGGTATGDVTVERFLSADKWHYISGRTQISDDFSVMGLEAGAGNDQFYRWDEVLETDNTPGTWVDILNGPDGDGLNTEMDETFVACRGYAVTYKTEDEILSLSGVPYTVNKVINITNTSSGTNPGANLVGNPFTSTIAINDDSQTENFIDQNASVLALTKQAVYLWDDINSEYITIANGIGAKYIAPGQGFMIVAKNASEDLEFNEDIRKHGAATFYKNTNNDDVPRMVLSIKDSENRRNNTTISFLPNMTLGLDPSYDAGKLKGNPNIALYTRLVEDNGVDFAIQALPDNDIESMVIPVGVDVIEEIICEFSINPDVMEGYQVYLQDTKENTVTNLKEHTYSTLVSESGIGRFFLHFKEVLGIDEPTTAIQLIQTWAANSTINIFNEHNLSGDVKVLNTFGQVIVTTKLTGDANQQIAVNSQSGIYIVNITTKKGIVNKKVYLR